MKIIEDTNEGIDWQPSRDNAEQYIFVTYRHRTALDPKEAAYFLAREQSVSTYNRLYGETIEMREQRSAKVVEVDQDRLVLAYPAANIQNQIGELLVTINGNGNFLNSYIFSSLIVDSISFPDDWLSRLDGPKYGKELLAIFDVTNRPILIGVQKPSIGLPVKEHVARAMEAFHGGSDIVKDDEQLYPDDPVNMLKERLGLLASEMKHFKQETGRHPFFIFNLEAENNVLEHCRLIEQHHSNPPMFGVMLSPLLGVPFIHYVRRNTQLPIFSHSSGFGIFCRGPFGFSNSVFTKLLRLAGVDCVIHPGPFSKIAHCNAETARAVKETCDESFGQLRQSALAFGGGMRKENFVETRNVMTGNDFIFLVGGAIFSHPDGPRAGAEDVVRFMVSHQR